MFEFVIIIMVIEAVPIVLWVPWYKRIARNKQNRVSASDRLQSLYAMVTLLYFVEDLFLVMALAQHFKWSPGMFFGVWTGSLVALGPLLTIVGLFRALVGKSNRSGTSKCPESE